MKENISKLYMPAMLWALLVSGSYAQVINVNTSITLDQKRTNDNQYGNTYSSLYTTIDSDQLRYGVKSSASADAEFSPTELRAKTHIADDPNGSAGSASAGIVVTDLATVSSASLPVGTAVSFDIDLFMHGGLTTTYSGYPTTTLNFPDMYGQVGYAGQSAHTETHDSGTYLVDLHIDSQVGQTSYLSYEFATSVLIEQGFIGGSLTADGWNTAYIYTQSNQDVQLLSSDGSYYRNSPVPAPPSLYTLGLGALGLIRRRVRQRP